MKAQFCQHVFAAGDLDQLRDPADAADQGIVPFLEIHSWLCRESGSRRDRGEALLVAGCELVGALGRVRIVRHHDNRLPVLSIERLKKLEHFIACFPVEIAGRLVAEQQRWVDHDGPRDPDALLLSARELARIVLRAVGKAHDLEGDADPFPPLTLRELRQKQRQLDVALGREHRQEVVELEDEADVLRAPF